VEENVTVYEMDSVEMSCKLQNVQTNQTVEWHVNNTFHRKRLEEAKKSPVKSRPITTPGGELVTAFERTARYNTTKLGDFFNLTIARVNMTEAGEYICLNPAARLTFSYIRLRVLGKIL
jgi:hypothetical protein